jgi:hypothetical protein
MTLGGQGEWIVTGGSPSSSVSMCFLRTPGAGPTAAPDPWKQRCPMATAQQPAYPESDVMRPAVAPKSSGAKNSRAPRGTTSSARRKTSSSRGRAAGPPAKKPAATTAGESLDRAQHALDQAAKTEKRLQASLKKNSEAVSAVKQDLARRSRDLEEMESQLKMAKKSRKRAAKELSRTTNKTTTTK